MTTLTAEIEDCLWIEFEPGSWQSGCNAKLWVTPQEFCPDCGGFVDLHGIDDGSHGGGDGRDDE